MTLSQNDQKTGFGENLTNGQTQGGEPRCPKWFLSFSFLVML
jgi:hypothetical protein